MAKTKAKAPKNKAAKDVLPEDLIIEGEVSTPDDEVPHADKPLPQKTKATGSIFAVIFSLIALGLATILLYERQTSNDAIDEKLALFATQMTELENQTLAQIQSQDQIQVQTQDQIQAQAEEITKLGAALQEAILAKPETKNAANPRQAAGLIALMMWQDMRAGQSLDDYQPFIMTLSDEDAKKRLTAVITAWQSVDYQGLLAQGRGFIGGKALLDHTGQVAERPKESIVSGIRKWVAGLVKLEPLDGQQDVPSEQMTEQGVTAPALSLEEIVEATATQDGAQIDAWRKAVGQVVTQQGRLSALIIDYLTDETILP